MDLKPRCQKFLFGGGSEKKLFLAFSLLPEKKKKKPLTPRVSGPLHSKVSCTRILLFSVSVLKSLPVCFSAFAQTQNVPVEL